MNDSYRGKLVLVTGGLGFIGLNLVRQLQDAGARVRILNRSQDSRALAWLEGIARGRSVEVTQGEIADAALLPEWLSGGDVLFDLAGQSGAARSLAQARADMHANISGHLNLLECIRCQEIPPRIVFVSSRLVYGTTGREPVREDHPALPTSLYGLHKLTAEHYCRLYHLHYGIPYTALRLTNPYGPYQLPQRSGYGVANHFIMTALRGEALTVFGEANQLRDYIHIDDAARAMLLAGVLPNAVGQTFNLGVGHSVSLDALANTIVTISGTGTVEHTPWPALDQKVETGDFVCDISRIKELLGWMPEITLNEGLERTLRDYRVLLA